MFHVRPRFDGGFVRGDGWRVDVGNSDLSKTLLWAKEGEQPIRWLRPDYAEEVNDGVAWTPTSPPTPARPSPYRSTW